MPVRRRTSAMTGAIRGSATPSAWWPALAGLVRGPRKLKTVGTPSSRRGAAAWRNDGWNTGAKQKPMFTSPMVAATASGGRAMATPRASSRSALPQRPEAARLPCLATRWPAPTATSAARVETLKVPARSPPVPQVSSSGPGTANGAAAASMALTRPVTSSAVSPLIRRAVAKAAIWAGVASPASTDPMAAPACSSLRSSRRSSGPSTVGQANRSDTASSRVPSMLSAPSLTSEMRKDTIKQPGHARQGQRVDQQPRVSGLAAAMGADEAPELLLAAASLPGRLPLEGVEGPKLALGLDDLFHRGGANTADQLVLQGGAAAGEPEGFQCRATGGGAGPPAVAAEVGLPPGVAEAGQPDVHAPGTEPRQEAPDVPRPAHGHDGNAFGGKVPTTALRERLERDLVAAPLDKHDRQRSLAASCLRHVLGDREHGPGQVGLVAGAGGLSRVAEGGPGPGLVGGQRDGGAA